MPDLLLRRAYPDPEGHPPHCSPAAPILARLGLAADQAWLWKHIGPVGPSTTPLRLHGDRDGVSHRGRRIATGGDHAAHMPTPPELRSFTGALIDRLYVLEQPADAIARHATVGRRLGGGRAWCVYAAACFDPDGIWVDWDALEDLYAHHGVPGRLSTADDLRAYQRLEAALAGRGAIRGNVPLRVDPAHLAIATEAEALKRAHPDWSWVQIARRWTVDERTLRRYRQELELSRHGRSGPTMDAIVRLVGLDASRVTTDLDALRRVMGGET